MDDITLNKKQNENVETSKKNKKNVIFGKFFAKIKAIKHIEVVIAIIFVVIVLLIYFSSGGLFSSKSKNDDSNIAYSSLAEYSSNLEEKLVKVLSNIKGAGSVTAMITFNAGYSLEIAYKTETTTTKNRTGSGEDETIVVVTTPEYITKNGVAEPVVLQEKLPVAESVIVVASGAEDTKVRLELLRAVQAVLNLPGSSIQIFVGK